MKDDVSAVGDSSSLVGERSPAHPTSSYPNWIMRIRRRFWLSHGHDGLYGDDGEMQCPRCGLDYRRADLDKILDKLDELDRERFAVAERSADWGHVG